MSFAVKIHQCEHVINADHVFSRPSCARCRWRKRRHATDTAAEDLRVAHALHISCTAAICQLRHVLGPDVSTTVDFETWEVKAESGKSSHTTK